MQLITLLTPIQIVFLLYYPEKKPRVCPQVSPFLHSLIPITHGVYNPNISWTCHLLSTPTTSAISLLGCFSACKNLRILHSETFNRVWRGWSRRSLLNSVPESTVKKFIFASLIIQALNSVLPPKLACSLSMFTLSMALMCFSILGRSV